VEQMHSVLDMFTNRILLCAILSWFVAQALKVMISAVVDKHLDWRRLIGAGGMPSSHTSFVVSLTLMVGFTEGFNTAIFATCFTLAAIVMYDATGVRRETGKQGQVINEILRNVFIDGKPISDDNLKELVGHKPIEVAAGAIIGIVVALCFALL
jgi:uncharacterized protein